MDQLSTAGDQICAEHMAGEDSTAVSSTAEHSVSHVEWWSAREERKRRQFEEE